MKKAFLGFKLQTFIVYLLLVSVVYARSPWISDFKDGPAAAPSSVAGGPAGSQSVSVFGGWNSKAVIIVMVVAGSVGGGFVTFVGVCVYTLAKRKWSSTVVPCRNTMVHHSTSDCSEVKIAIDGGFAVERGNIVLSIEDLKMATGNFSQDNILGTGGFGTVYKGELQDGTKVAVKRMESRVMSSKVLDEFKSEIVVLTQVRHRNLVGLPGYCLDGDERLLVYEYMPQGTLSRFLFDWQEHGLKPLEWSQRLIIALDVARGVEYLHGLAEQSFIHRDLKSSNILLGDDMRAKVADFGLVRPAIDGKYSHFTRLAGTFGYFAPEYASMGQVTTKIDVFSFGVILMELLTGRKAVYQTQEAESVSLVQWFRRIYSTFQNVIDPTLNLDEEALVSVGTVAELASHCCADEPHQRPEMSHVVGVLSSLAEPWKRC